MTQGEFFLALAKLAGEYRHRNLVPYVSISKHAKEVGLSIDEEGPYAEQAEILRPLESFFQAAVQKLDSMEQCARMHLAWEAYQTYLRKRDVRLRATAYAD